MQIEFDAIARDVIRGHDLTRLERKEQDQYAWPNPVEWISADYPDRWFGNDVGWDKEFVRFGDEVIDLSDMEGANTPGWDNVRHDCHWWGILVRFGRECRCTDADGDNFGMHEYLCPKSTIIDDDVVFVARYLND
jgi:hypothetical protein